MRILLIAPDLNYARDPEAKKVRLPLRGSITKNYLTLTAPLRLTSVSSTAIRKAFC